ncbi:hypothetical protein Tco_0378316 [Tanacetum coccineum]
MSIQLADRSIKYPIGVCENLLVKTEEEDDENSNKALAVSFYSRTESVKPLEWKAPENRLKPSSVEPPKLEWKELPEHLEYAFLQENNQLQWSSHPHYPPTKKPGSSRFFEIIKGRSLRVLLTLKESTHTFVLTKSSWKTSSNQVSNLKDELTPISKSPWVSPVQVVPKKGGMTVVKNEKDGFSGYFQIPIAPEDQDKTTFTCPYGTFAYKRMPFGLCNAPTTFQRCMTAIFHEFIEDSMEIYG